jgi:hypothetical protein
VDSNAINYCLMLAFLATVPAGYEPEDWDVSDVELVASARNFGLHWRATDGHLTQVRRDDVANFINNNNVSCMGHTFGWTVDDFGARRYFVRTCAGCHDFGGDSDSDDEY